MNGQLDPVSKYVGNLLYQNERYSHCSIVVADTLQGLIIIYILSVQRPSSLYGRWNTDNNSQIPWIQGRCSGWYNIGALGGRELLARLV